MIRPANARRCWGPSDLTEAKQRGPTGETAPRAGKPPRLSASADPVHWGLFGVSAKPDKGIGERSSGSPRENRRRVLYFAVAKRHRGDTCLAVYFSTQEPRLKGACPQRFLVCAFCAAMAFDVWRRRVGAFHLAALSNEVLSYSHRHCFFGPDSNLLRFPSRRQLPLVFRLSLSGGMPYFRIAKRHRAW